MTTCTPIYGLTYAVGSDRPCDIGDTLCQFADEVEAQLDLLDAVIDRTVDTVPMARVRLTVPLSIVIPIAVNYTASIPFDSVDVDTADMVNLIANPYLITLPRPGVYYMAWSMTWGTIVANDEITMTMVNDQAGDQYWSDGSGPTYMSGSGLMHYDPANSPGTSTTTSAVTLDMFASFSAQTVTVTAAEAQVTWLRDLP